MNKLKFETPDMVTENVDKIAALFPSAITEMRGEDGEIKRGVNFEVLKQLLSRDVVDGDECYEFTWVLNERKYIIYIYQRIKLF